MSLPTPSPPEPGPVPEPEPPEESPGGSRPSVRRWAIPVAVAGILVAAGLAGGLYEAGIGPFHRSPSAPSGALSFDQAEAAGGSAVSSYPGGSWSLIAGGAVVVPNPEAIPLAAVQLGLAQYLGNCSLHWLASDATLTVPGVAGPLDSGASPFWWLVYRNSSISDTGVLVVTVVNGTASPTALVPGTSACLAYSEIASFVEPIASSAQDSPAILSAAEGAGGAAFLAAHPAANVTMEVSGAVALLGESTASQWNVALTLCPIGLPSVSTAPAFNATVEADSGAVVSAHSFQENCSSLSPQQSPGSASYALNASLNWSAPSHTDVGGTHWVNLTVSAASHGIEFGNLSVSVGGATQVTPTAAWSYDVRSPSGSVLAEYSPTSARCLEGATVAIEPGDTLSLQTSSTSLVGGSVILVGVGSFLGLEQYPVS